MLNSSAVAQQIARGLASSGVTEAVIAPGSRSAPLIYALAPLAEAGIIRTHVRIDERDAGFLALGLARGMRAKQATSDGGHGQRANGAVALVTTSGSAVANLHPAVLEASYGHLPLIAITADRPERLRGTGANQTIDDQSQVLSDVRARIDVSAGRIDAGHLLAEVAARSLGEGRRRRGDDNGPGGSIAEAGPVQFNVQFDVPLVPTVTELADWKAEVQTLAEKSPGAIAGVQAVDGPVAVRNIPIRLLPGTVIVAGDAGGHSAVSLKSLAEEHTVPVLAEPSSPLTFELRDSNRAVPAHAQVLAEREDLRTAIRVVIVHGKPTLTRPVAALLADPEVLVQRLPDDVDAVSLEAAADDDDGTGVAVKSQHAVDRVTWCDEWVTAGQAIVTAARRERETSSAKQFSSNPSAKPPVNQAVRPPVNQAAKPPVNQSSTQSVARAITEYLAGSAINLFAASSNTIRYLNEATDVRAQIHASRGLAGIDGLISTATGLSLALGEQVVLVIGDVAMLHDVGGLLTPSAEEEGDVLIVVLNDDGGAIFSGLEHSQDHVAPYLERYFTVPHGRDFRDLAAAYGWGYMRVGTHDEVGNEVLGDFIADFEEVAGSEEVAEFEKADGGPGTKRRGRRIIEVNLT